MSFRQRPSFLYASLFLSVWGTLVAAGAMSTFADDTSTPPESEVISPPKSLLDAPPKPKSLAICGDCGKEINGDEKKCPHCGVELTDAYEAPPELLAPSTLTAEVVNSGGSNSGEGTSTAGSGSSTPGIRTAGPSGSTSNNTSVSYNEGEEGSGNAIVDFLKSFKGITMMTGLCMLFFFWKLNS